MFFAVAGFLWLLMLSGKGNRLVPAEFRRSSPRILAASIVVVVFGAMSSFRSWDPPGSIGAVMRLGYLTMVWFWMLRCLSVNRRAVAAFISAWRWGVLVTSAAVILAYAGMFSLGVPNAEERQTGWFGHPNDLGGFLAVAVPLFLLGAPTAVTQRRRTQGAWRAVLLGVVIFGMSTSGSMSAFLAAAAGGATSGLVLALTRSGDRRRRRLHPLKAMALVIVGMIALLLLASTDSPVVERFTRYGEGDAYIESSVGDRGTANERVINNLDDALVIGNGFDRLGQADLDLDLGVHNMYLKLLYEGGLITASALVLILVVCLQQAWRLLRNTRSTLLHRDIAAVMGSAVAAIVFSNFQPTSIQRFFWIPFAMIQCYWTLRRSEIASGQTEDELNAWSAPPAAAAARSAIRPS